MVFPLADTEVLGQWAAHSSYVVIDGFLRNEGREHRVYRPQEHSELPFAIAKLANARDPELRKFARQWGLLGFEWLWWRDHPKERRLTSTGDPLDWVKLHAHYMALGTELTDGLSREAPDAIVAAIKSHLYPEPTSGSPSFWLWPYDSSQETQLRRTWARPGDYWEPAVPHASLENDPLVAGELVLDKLVNRHIRDIHPTLERYEGGFKLGFSFTALIEVAYIHLARLAADSSAFDRCEECGALFRKLHGNQRFCSPGPYDTESKCSYRHRYRRMKKPKGVQG